MTEENIKSKITGIISKLTIGNMPKDLVDTECLGCDILQDVEEEFDVLLNDSFTYDKDFMTCDEIIKQLIPAILSRIECQSGKK